MVGALWIDYRFFTIWANTLVGLVCAAIALGRVPPHWLTAGPALAIALVAGVYHALLAEGRNLTCLDLVVDAMLHSVVPAGFIFLDVCLAKGSPRMARPADLERVSHRLFHLRHRA